MARAWCVAIVKKKNEQLYGQQPRQARSPTLDPPSASTGGSSMVVLELYYKGGAELIEKLLPNVILPLRARLQPAAGATAAPPPGGQPQHRRLSRVLLTYKGRPSAVDNPADAALLRAALPADVAVSAVWSAKNAYVGTGKTAPSAAVLPCHSHNTGSCAGPHRMMGAGRAPGKSARAPYDNREDATFARFVEYNTACETAGCASILVVSGAGGKKALDAIGTCERAAATAPPVLPLGVGVANNTDTANLLTPSPRFPSEPPTRLRGRVRAHLLTGGGKWLGGLQPAHWRGARPVRRRGAAREGVGAAAAEAADRPGRASALHCCQALPQSHHRPLGQPRSAERLLQPASGRAVSGPGCIHYAGAALAGLALLLGRGSFAGVDRVRGGRRGAAVCAGAAGGRTEAARGGGGGGGGRRLEAPTFSLWQLRCVPGPLLLLCSPFDGTRGFSSAELRESHCVGVCQAVAAAGGLRSLGRSSSRAKPGCPRCASAAGTAPTSETRCALLLWLPAALALAMDSSDLQQARGIVF